MVGIFAVLAASRFIPHPPNFTSLIALSFYVPVFFGINYISVVILSFVITDVFIGFHSLMFFTWGSVILIGLISKYLKNNIYKRIFGVFAGAIIFYLLTNFGVWLTGQYGFDFKGLITTYYLAIPFFGYTIFSTIIYSILIESLNKFFKIKKMAQTN